MNANLCTIYAAEYQEKCIKMHEILKKFTAPPCPSHDGDNDDEAMAL